MSFSHINKHLSSGIDADLYELPDNVYGDSLNNENNTCYDTNDYRAIKGLQNISPCQYGKSFLIGTPKYVTRTD